MKFSIEVTLYHEWQTEETVSVTVEADSADSAIAKAKGEAEDMDVSYYDYDWDKTTYSGSTKILSCEDSEGQHVSPPFRCDKTPDMFAGKP